MKLTIETEDQSQIEAILTAVAGGKATEVKGRTETLVKELPKKTAAPVKAEKPVPVDEDAPVTAADIRALISNNKDKIWRGKLAALFTAYGVESVSTLSEKYGDDLQPFYDEAVKL